jgi:dTDP-4-dehydrorhamnose 3,5-epimerase
VHPLDPELALPWPSDVEHLLSDKDAAAPSLAEAQASGLLPDFAQCQAFYAGLRGGRPRPGLPQPDGGQ